MKEQFFLIYFLEELSVSLLHPKDSPLIDPSSDLHAYYERRLEQHCSEEEVGLADFNNVRYSDKRSRTLCFKDDRLPGCIRNPEFHADSDECLNHIVTYIYVIWKRGCTVQGFFEDEGGVLYRFLELLIRRYVDLLEDEEPVVLVRSSPDAVFEESKDVADFLYCLIEILEAKEDHKDKDWYILLDIIFNGVVRKYPGAISILHCANWSIKNIELLMHKDGGKLCLTESGFQMHFHLCVLFRDDCFESFPIHLGLYTIIHILETLVANESVRNLQQDEIRRIYNRIEVFFSDTFCASEGFERASKELSSLLWGQMF
jgi:hypothetical protein